MAYDKAVDSSILDAALTATAERIREKTGSSDQLIWNETTGFADGIGSIDISSQSKSVTPSASQQTVSPDSGYKYLSQVTVEGDSNLAAENIAEGVSIFGVLGTKAAGAQIVEGSFTGSSLKTYTCSELPFKPSRLMVWSMFDHSGSLGSSRVYVYLHHLDTGAQTSNNAIVWKNSGGSSDSGYYCYGTRVNYSSYFNITFTDNGFTISSVDTSLYYYLNQGTKIVYWMAFE